MCTSFLFYVLWHTEDQKTPTDHIHRTCWPSTTYEWQKTPSLRMFLLKIRVLYLPMIFPLYACHPTLTHAHCMHVYGIFRHFSFCHPKHVLCAYVYLFQHCLSSLWWVVLCTHWTEWVHCHATHYSDIRFVRWFSMYIHSKNKILTLPAKWIFRLRILIVLSLHLCRYFFFFNELICSSMYFPPNITNGLW